MDNICRDAGAYTGVSFTATDGVDPFPTDTETISIALNQSGLTQSFEKHLAVCHTTEDAINRFDQPMNIMTSE